ncbi:hypothetical protein OG909_20575 [Streptomyces sp. NBC_01754]|uniref:hypothetical protein n=1 Tax=Streptomyces sp. NBC_01754 TaxID=2975930 RepID=UPI002DDBF8D6|nr:hypothetical protein [Streptomyces sp. NBC_01754]WSC94474.1 hypothetical protein OG909_20575 [Streptomyces sp. NBC_01754]
MRGERAYDVRGTLRPDARPAAGVRPRRAATALTAVVACVVLAAGCGIRSTSVPVDAGAAPSRVPCRTSAADARDLPPGSLTVQVYLVCASQLEPVERTVEIGGSGPDGVRVARALLDQLRQAPSDDERRAGFSTLVPAGLRLTGGREGDPKGTLRLSEQPEDLPAEALAQLVCSYAESDAGGSGGSALLGGPGKYPPRDYLCTSRTKSRPTDVPTLKAAP